jgi:hypothetical protein
MFLSILDKIASAPVIIKSLSPDAAETLSAQFHREKTKIKITINVPKPFHAE